MAMSVRDSEGDGDGDEAIVAEINITPLTDIFLVLLIIFMVTSTAMVQSEMAQRSGVKVTLPKANAAATAAVRNDPILTITKDGALYLGSQRVTAERAEEQIRAALTKGHSTTLLIRGDQSVFLGKAVDVMGLAKRAGAEHIAIVTQGGSK
jgi:biopolymer transport protein ExbD